ncbi:epimerase [Arthrobacter sp. MYb227]|uniref:NAD-dependent epimerase/dehydratase family protein n=1 Tax=Arthrobacter sp. MYb227 TaxID=1848601 RepID=UPI000CFA84CB|nr:NAD-dependent epimerase/dehydratase family protein [Arthrobacter sp. MYb227]PQZ93620.1 epimerase [Arthrobacter sp. MYb227]
MPNKYLVTGAGPIGCTVALTLANQGHNVTLASRSGNGPEHRGIKKIRADALQPTQLDAAVDGANAVFHCIHAAYSAKAWAQTLPVAEEAILALAGKHGIPVIFPESLYSYSKPGEVMREDSPRNATGGKRGIRTALLHARAASDTNTVSVVASDYYGPYAQMVHAGTRMLEAVHSGRRLVAVGNPIVPHSFTFLPDLAAAMIRAALREDLWNNVLHAPTAPPASQQAMLEAFAEAAGRPAPKISGISGHLLRAAGLVHPATRELAEMAYQFDKPFAMNSAHSQALLGLSPTLLAEGARRTVEWWRKS